MMTRHYALISRRGSLSCTLLLALTSALHAEDAQRSPPRPVRILTVGNGFMNWVPRAAPTPQQLARLHAVYFERMDESLAALNRKIGRQVVFVVPVGQAVVALRAMIAMGKVAEIPKQSDLFADRLGHPKEVIRALSAYCHFAVIYRKSPEGLPTLPSLKQHGYSEDVNLILQRLSWDAVTQHTSSGVSVP